ncbi:unnamed protein product [Paramecium octaurelia]|uniref:Uncharacterized protein n=1 Tax=Paramecium octaurelia TaxID=43137 RepID=A0A8S1RTK9_PAROT|nr:unnamed protein product [Paramecium octaurelia]
MVEQTQLILGCNRIIWQSNDRKEKIYEIRQVKKDAHFLKLYWTKGPGYRTLKKGKWYRFKNYKIVNNILQPIPNVYFEYNEIKKPDKKELKIEDMREPYSNLLGIIQDEGDVDEFSRQYPFRVIEILLLDGNTVQVLLKNRFATERKEKFQTGEIIYIYGCRKHIHPQNQEFWYSSLTNNTKIKFDLQTIRQHVSKHNFGRILKLKTGFNDQDEATGQVQ